MDPVGSRLYVRLLPTPTSAATRVWVLKPRRVVKIGRAEDCDYVVDDPGVSRLHAELHWCDDHWEIINHGRFGTLLNGNKIDRSRVGPGADLFRLGEAGPYLRFVPGAGEPEQEVTVATPPAADPASQGQQTTTLTASEFLRAARENRGR